MSNKLRSFIVVLVSIVVVMSALPLNALVVRADAPYTITFNSNGGTGSKSYSSNANGEVIILDETESNSLFKKMGYKVSGWTDTNNNPYAFSQEITLSDHLTLYAQWTFDSENYYKITFDKNGGDGDMPDQIVSKSSATVNIDSNTFTGTDGKIFIGWKDNDANKSYNDKDSITLTGDVTLTAQWAEPCTITFHANYEGNTETDTQTVPVNVATVLDNNTFAAPTTPAGTEFVGWALTDASDNNTIAYLDGSEITATTDMDLYAKWAVPCTVKFNKNAPSGETVNGTVADQTVGQGMITNTNKYDLSCDHYTFAGWNDQANGNGTDYTDTIDLTGRTDSTITLYAQWKAKKYTITFKDHDDTVLQSSLWEYNTMPSCAEPTRAPTNTETYSFDEWSPSIVAVNGEATYIAVYNSETRKYHVTVSSFPDGIANVSGAGNDFEYSHTTNLTSNLKDTTNPNGYYFVGWKDGNNIVNTNENVTGFQVTKDFDLVATYDNHYKVTLNASTGGSVKIGDTTNTSGSFEYNSEITLNAIPNTTNGYYFVRWKDENNQTISEEATYTYTVKNEITITAEFDNHYTITLDPSVGGVVSIGDGSTTSGSYPYNTKITLKATPNVNGYYFVEWNDGNGKTSTNTEYEYTVTGTRTIKATFNNTYTVSATSDSAQGSVSGDGTFIYGETAKLSATPFEGYYFVNWTVNGGEVSTNSTYEFTVTENVSLVANFDNQYDINTSAEDSSKGSTSGGGSYTYGDNITVVATPNTGYHFVKWTVNGTTVSTDSKFSFPVKGDCDLVAVFEIDRHTILFVNEDGTVLQSEVLEYGMTPVYTKATPTKPRTQQYSYTFAGWDKEITKVTGDKTYTATYSSTINYYTVKYVNDDGTVLQESQIAYGGSATYQHMANPTKKPTAQYTYTFAGWDNKDTLVTKDLTFTAVYTSTVNKYKITFANEDGTVLQTSEVEYGKFPVYDKSAPTKSATVEETFTFAGWDKEIAMVTGDTVYTAKYTSKPITKDSINYKYFTVAFVSNGGSEVVSQLVAEGGVAFKPEEPLRERYSFGGWYIDEALTKPFSFATAITSDITLYAKWVKGAPEVEATYAVIGLGSVSFDISSNEDITIAVERSKDNDTIAKHFRGVQIDGVDVDYYNYELSDDNSAVIIKADALDGIDAGKHTITIVYDDGTAEVELIVADGDEPVKITEEIIETEPETGAEEPVNVTAEKNNNAGLWIALAIVAGVVVAAIPIFIVKIRSLK